MAEIKLDLESKKSIFKVLRFLRGLNLSDKQLRLLDGEMEGMSTIDIVLLIQSIVGVAVDAEDSLDALLADLGNVEVEVVQELSFKEYKRLLQSFFEADSFEEVTQYIKSRKG